MSAPPPKEKNDRKKLDAANAIDRPKTIWTRRRKPPLESPNASVRPVTTMMITPTTLATGPCTESRIDWSGVSQGIAEPAAFAGTANRVADVVSAAKHRRLPAFVVRARTLAKFMINLRWKRWGR